MYSVLLVDDEYMILKGLEKIINWQDFGFQVVKTAKSAQAALAILEETSIDLIITDVNMPQINGLSLIEEAQKLAYEFEFIVLSGYQEFEYAQQSVKLGGLDYLVKPVDAKMLQQALIKTKQKLDQKKANLTNAKFAHKIALEKLFEADLTETQQTELLENYQITDTQIMQGITVIACNQLTDFTQIEKFAEQYKQKLYFKNKKQLFIAFIGSAGFLAKFVNELEGQQLIAGASFITVGETVTTMAALNSSYQQAKQLAEIYLFYANQSSFSSNHSRVEWLKQATLPKVSLLKFRQAVAIGDENAINQQIEFVYTQLAQNNATPTYVRQVTFLIFSELNRQVNFAQQMYQIYANKINQSQHIEELKTLIQEILDQKQSSHSKYSENIQKTLGIVQQEFQTDLNLKFISDRLHLNTNYLGQLFKKEIGESFSKYLNDYRIQIARKLLTDSQLSIADVANQVGYGNVGYFYRTFKAICGISPKEYRDKY